VVACFEQDLEASLAHLKLPTLHHWVRRPRRVAVWNAAKLLINAARLTRNRALAA
jgi:hypothetical protein